MKVVLVRFLLFMTSITIAVLLSACAGSNKAIPVAIFLAAANPDKTPTPVDATALTQTSASLSATPVAASVLSSLANEQKEGYEYPMDSNAPALAPSYNIENDPQEEIAVKVRELVEDKNQPAAMALIGATSNEGSVRLASLSNFFFLPMIIPSAIGDNLLPSNNLWGFRLSAPGSEHSRYFFGSVLTHLMVQSLGGASDLASTSPQIKIAILYEQNTFGESAAVAAVKEAMKQEIKIGFYGSFNPSAPDPAKLKEQIDQIKNPGQGQAIQLIYLISNDPDAALVLVEEIKKSIPENERPILLGQSGAFSSSEFLGSTEAQGMYILQQKIYTDNCPVKIKSLNEAQSYAAVTLLSSALQQAQLGNGYASQPLGQKREAIRNVLKANNIKNLPCLGPISFDIAGQNKNLEFEILQVTANGPVAITTDDFKKNIETIDNLINPFGSGH